jgi:hypothetical protein
LDHRFNAGPGTLLRGPNSAVLDVFLVIQLCPRCWKINSHFNEPDDNDESPRTDDIKGKMYGGICGRHGVFGQSESYK